LDKGFSAMNGFYYNGTMKQCKESCLS